ncbi:hypothetical protein [Clostridium perfringens]|uniref:hypothetical protein n=1 Tax=Clostridium perfringens TaxID=1502 RepID=UPI0039EA60FF
MGKATENKEEKIKDTEDKKTEEQEKEQEQEEKETSKETEKEDSKEQDTKEQEEKEDKKEDKEEDKKEEAPDNSAELEATKKQLNEYETVVNKLVESKMENVPDVLKALIPESMTAIQKLDWIEKLEDSGVLETLTEKKEKKDAPNVEIGKPMNVDSPAVDTEKLSPAELMALSYASVKK